MHALRFLFSPSGRLPPRTFVVAALAVYIAGAASQLLTAADMTARGFWLFAAIQALLIWIWYALHAKRLRDADAPVGLAAGVSVLYALSVALLLLVAAAFFATATSATTEADATGAMSVILFVTIIATLSASSHYDAGWFIVAIFTALATLPVLLAVVVTVWAATRPSSNKQTA
jgi:uncharacterized membrane protein YhaH (DUF805 family)